MYALIWRCLPGGWVIKTIETLVLVAGIMALLWFVVFPWLEPKLPIDHITVG